MLRIYQILSTLLIPVIIFNIFIRIYRKKEDRLRFIERFGKPTVKKNTEKKTKSTIKAPKKDLENFDVYWPKILQEGKNILTPRKYSYITLVSPQIEDKENLTLYVDDENDYLITELKKSQDILEFIESEIAKIMGLKVSIQVKAAKGLSENSSTENNVQENISDVFDIENID